MTEWSIQGIIWCVALGLAAGNYACSLVYRLPRGLVLRDHPYCSNCHTPLQTRDLFPLLSWFWMRGRSRCCNQPIPVVYVWIEIFSALVFVLSYVHFGFSEPMILSIFTLMCLLMAACIEWQGGAVPRAMVGVSLAGIALFSTLHAGSIYPWLTGAGVGYFMCLGVAYLQGEYRGVGLPVGVEYWVLAGAAAQGGFAFLLMLPVIFLLRVIFRKKSRIQFLPFALVAGVWTLWVQ